MSNINHNTLIIFISSVLGNPVRVQKTKSTEFFTNSALSKRSEVSVSSKMVDTSDDWFTVGNTTSDSSFSSSSSDSDSVDDKSLFSSVT